MTPLTIRAEEPGDEGAIFALTRAAFHEAPHADGDEAELVERLRDSSDLTLSLVALNTDRAIIGHIAFSPCTIRSGTDASRPGEWFQLAPVSVIPLRQKTGIGRALIEEGLARMHGRGALGIPLVGDPEYYRRFGFSRDHGLTLDAELDPYLQVRLLNGETMPEGKLTLAPAFD